MKKVVIGDCTLYQGDCLEVMPTLESGSVDAVVTDPPYGINATHAGGRGVNGWRKFDTTKWDTERPPREAFDEILRIGRKCLIWGGNYFTDYLRPTMQWLVWDKGQRNFSLADCEFAWSSEHKASRIFTYSRAIANKHPRMHPTQKPIALMEWCMDTLKIPEQATVFDPFMGSGTTGVACVNTNRRFIGIELDETYFNVAVKRIEEAYRKKAEELPLAG